MVKKILYLILMSFLIIKIISCTEKKQNIFKIEKGQLLINEKIKINLSKPIKEVLDKLGNQYEEEEIPSLIGYYLTNYPLGFFVNSETNKIESIFFVFYDTKSDDKKKFIDELILSQLTIKNNTSFDELKKILNDKKIKYKIDEMTAYYDFIIDNLEILSIQYMKFDLNCPSKIEVEIK